MSRAVILRRQARIEYDEAADWYDARSPGLGLRFEAAFQEVLDSASTSPERHPRVFGEVHEALVHGFPYCVYFTESRGRILVIAVFHTARNPSIWQSRS